MTSLEALGISLKRLGTCVVERDGKAFLVAFSDGRVRAYANLPDAQKAINRHFAAKTPAGAIGVGQVVSYDGSITVTNIDRAASEGMSVRGKGRVGAR